MSKQPSKITRFWQELRRRKVIKAAAMHAATAFILIEAAEIMLPRLGLPDWTVTFVIVLLIVGFPITLILSWIFDITPKGVEKTESIEEVNQPMYSTSVGLLLKGYENKRKESIDKSNELIADKEPETETGEAQNEEIEDKGNKLGFITNLKDRISDIFEENDSSM